MDNDDFTGTELSDDVLKEYVYKVVVVGNYSVGKTTLIKRLMASRLPPDAPQAPVEDVRVSPTVGTDFFSHLVPDVTPGQNVRLQIWDTAGLQRYATVHESTYRNASLVLCVFDVTDMHTLEDLMERHLTVASDYIPNLDQQNLVFIGNKTDLLVKDGSGDNAARQKALAANARRAASPEAAFTDGGVAAGSAATSSGAARPAAGRGDANAEDGEEPVDLEAIVTVADVQAQVFSLLPDANYVEVSARTGEGVADALDRICKAALYNDHALPSGSDPLMDSHEALSRSRLPKNRVLLRVAGLFQEAGRAPPPQTQTTVPSTARATAATDSPPLPTPTERDDTAVPEHRLNKAYGKEDAVPAASSEASPTGSSWRQSGAFSFDMAPPNNFDETMHFPSDAFSPVEHDDHGEEEDAAARGASAKKGNPAKASTTSGSALAAEQKRLLRTPISQLSPQEREARRALEHEEMKGLLSRGNDKKAAGDTTREPLEAGGATTLKKPNSGFADLDADDDGAAGRKPFRSVLDDEVERRAAERGDNEPTESDEDAVAFQDRLRARMNEVDKDASLKKIETKRARDREKADKKKKKGDKVAKADGKCSVCQCS